MHNLNLAMIGNCQIAALIDESAKINWACFPRFDGDPSFCSLLNSEDCDRGFFAIELADHTHTEQQYIENAPILKTIMRASDGSAIEIVDFCPRFVQFERIFHPASLVRRMRPLSGSPKVTVRCRPATDYGANAPQITSGSNHIRYVGRDVTLRLTANTSVSHILEERPFILHQHATLILGPDESVAESVRDLGRRFFENTQHYWQSWARGLSIPFEWQEAVIRAAITLKLCTYEDTGAIIAAATTSIPEAPNTVRNWDYRYCWLRDSYFTVNALNALGATKTMRSYLRYIMNIAVASKDGFLQPVYSITGRADLTESTLPHLAGYRGMQPVRVGNQAFEQIQHDVYGSVILSGAHYFFDKRLVNSGTEADFHQLETIGQQAIACFGKPDAGLWEYRGRQRVHTFPSMMCWAACDRLARIAKHLGLAERMTFWRSHADQMHQQLHEHAWNPKLNAFSESFDDDSLDASLLLIHELGFVAADDPKFKATVETLEKNLRHGAHMFRYNNEDDFGFPETAFNVCTFWYINALAALGRTEEARELFENMLQHRNRFGLLSEDLDPKSGELWGNFPQTYSLVGIIQAAMRLSKPWEY